MGEQAPEYNTSPPINQDQTHLSSNPTGYVHHVELGGAWEGVRKLLTGKLGVKLVRVKGHECQKDAWD